MSQNWKRPLKCLPEQEVAAYLAEVRDLADDDLWEEVSAKLADVLVVYRRALRARTVRFTDDRQRQLTEMAWSHAFAEVFGDESNPDVI